MTDMEILASVINDIGRISVPIDYAEQIAAPLVSASNRLKQLYNDLLDRAQQQPAPGPEAMPEDIPEDIPEADPVPEQAGDAGDDEEEFT